VATLNKPKCQYEQSELQYNTKFVKRRVAVASEVQINEQLVAS